MEKTQVLDLHGFLRYDGQIQGRINHVENKISLIEDVLPAQVSTDNPLADQSFVNSSISTNTAKYISNNGVPFVSLAELYAYNNTLTNNDYAFIVGTDSSGNTVYSRYKYNSETKAWAKEYELNNSSFTAAQWAAINSGITAALVGLISSAVQPDAISDMETKTHASGAYQPKGDYALKGELPIVPTLAKVATSGSYNDLSDKPSIPTIPSSLPASDVYSWAKAESKPSYTAAEIGALASTHAASGVTAAKIENWDAAYGWGNHADAGYLKTHSLTGYAKTVDLLENGLIKSSLLPSYVDDVIEGYLYNGNFYKEAAHTNKISGEGSKIYVDLSTNKTYRWGGSAYVVISETLAIGTTAGTACAGNDARLSDARPASDVYSWAKAESKPSYAWTEITGKPTFAGVATSGNYNDLSNKPSIPTIPSSLPASDVYSWAKAESKPSYAWTEITGKPTFAGVATSGSYNDLSDKPTIPTIPSSLPANGGNADTVGNYHFSVGSSAGTDPNTIYFVI